MTSLSPLLEEILDNGGTVELTVTGNSMYPMLLHKKSRVRLAPVNTLCVGDLPLYRRDNGAFILHRVIAVENGTYVCCGDHQWHPEYGIRKDQIIAVVIEFKRGKHWISCRNSLYCCYWHFWIAIRPLRRLLFGGLRRLKYCAGKVFFHR